jgi:hypothetical protein
MRHSPRRPGLRSVSTTRSCSTRAERARLSTRSSRRVCGSAWSFHRPGRRSVCSAGPACRGPGIGLRRRPVELVDRGIPVRSRDHLPGCRSMAWRPGPSAAGHRGVRRRRPARCRARWPRAPLPLAGSCPPDSNSTPASQGCSALLQAVALRRRAAGSANDSPLANVGSGDVAGAVSRSTFKDGRPP